ncbi:MAG: hypothetical protein ACP5NF_11625, partial [Thermoanaerobaculum sp.]
MVEAREREPKGAGKKGNQSPQQLVSAVPQYVARHFDERFLPPGHAFRLYFKGWTEKTWELSKSEKLRALQSVVNLGNCKSLLEKLAERTIRLA